MSEKESDGPYVYQPYGVQDVLHWKQGRLYAVGGLDRLATVKGLTKGEADSICHLLILMREKT